MITAAIVALDIIVHHGTSGDDWSDSSGNNKGRRREWRWSYVPRWSPRIASAATAEAASLGSGGGGTLLIAQNRFKSNQSATTAKRACRYEPYVIDCRPMQQTAPPSSDTAACASNGGEHFAVAAKLFGSTNR